MKDTLERTREPNLDLKEYLRNAYIHPLFKHEDDSDSDSDSESDLATINSDHEPELVPTKRQSRRNTPLPSKHSGSSPPSISEVHVNCQP